MDAEDDGMARAVRRAQQVLRGQQPTTDSIAADLDAVFAGMSERTFALTRRLVADEELARELAQEAMLTAWERLPELQDETAFRAWLFSIARHLCWNRVRKKGEMLTEDGVLEVGDPALDVLSELAAAEREEVLMGAARRALDPQEQEAVYLRYVEGLSQEEITVVLQLDTATGGRGLLQRCRRKLEREIRAELERLGHRSTFFEER
jgi:RNA polymerase sigma-70 factor (ECF subfamily)